MIFFLVLVVIWAVMMVFPFTLGFMSQHTGVEEIPLEVKSNNTRDPRYFAKSFRALVDKALLSRNGDTIMLSKQEKFLDGDLIKGEERVDCLVIAEGKLFTQADRTFTKEILARSYAGIGERNRLRAIACQEELTLQEGCEVERWADAEGMLRIHPNCYLGISATSNERIVIDPGCIFRRLYAPQIIVGQDDKIRCIDRCRIYTQEKVCADILWNHDRVDDGEKVEHTLISTGSIKIGKNAVVYGDVKSNHNIRVMKGAIISGNVIADGTIALDEDVEVRGILFSQESIYVGANNEIGECGMIKSVIAREKVTLCEGAVVYGYISGEKPCETVDCEQYEEELRSVY